MPTNLKFKISDQESIRNKLIELGFNFIESKLITDIYLQSEENETRKLRIEANSAKLISFKKLESGIINCEPTITFKTAEEGLSKIGSSENTKRTLNKSIDIFIKNESRAIIHNFRTENKPLYLSLEEEDETTALNILSLLNLDINNRIETSFDELI